MYWTVSSKVKIRVGKGKVYKRGVGAPQGGQVEQHDARVARELVCHLVGHRQVAGQRCEAPQIHPLPEENVGVGEKHIVVLTQRWNDRGVQSL
jgi:hypothetical protein